METKKIIESLPKKLAEAMSDYKSDPTFFNYGRVDFLKGVIDYLDNNYIDARKPVTFYQIVVSESEWAEQGYIETETDICKSRYAGVIYESIKLRNEVFEGVENERNNSQRCDWKIDGDS